MRSELNEARRARWRADLAELAGAASAIFGGTENQGAKKAEAELHRLHADLLEALGYAKDHLASVKAKAVEAASKDQLKAIALNAMTVDELPEVAEARAEVAGARDELLQAVHVWRLIDQTTGNRARHSIINNFSEPSFAELEGMGY